MSMPNDEIEQIDFEEKEDDGISDIEQVKYEKPERKLKHKIGEKIGEYKEKFSEYQAKQKAKKALEKIDDDRYKQLLNKEKKRLKYKQEVSQLRKSYSAKKQTPRRDMFSMGGGMNLNILGTPRPSRKSKGVSMASSLDIFGSRGKSNTMNFISGGSRKKAISFFDTNKKRRIRYL